NLNHARLPIPPHPQALKRYHNRLKASIPKIYISGVGLGLRYRFSPSERAHEPRHVRYLGISTTIRPDGTVDDQRQHAPLHHLHDGIEKDIKQDKPANEKTKNRPKQA